MSFFSGTHMGFPQIHVRLRKDKLDDTLGLLLGMEHITCSTQLVALFFQTCLHFILFLGERWILLQLRKGTIS
jgi:hypothetical protein